MAPDPDVHPTTDRAVVPADEAGTIGPEVVRSEERLLVSTRAQVVGRAVLRKYVVTETVTPQTFQVRHEEVRLEHLPATGDPGTAADRTPFEEGVVADIVLHREVPKVVMEVVATERVRLLLENVTSQVQMQEELRRERVGLDTPELDDGRPDSGRPPA